MRERKKEEGRVERRGVKKRRKTVGIRRGKFECLFQLSKNIYIIYINIYIYI